MERLGWDGGIGDQEVDALIAAFSQQQGFGSGDRYRLRACAVDPAHQAACDLFLPAQHQNVTLLSVFRHGASNSGRSAGIRPDRARR